MTWRDIPYNRPDEFRQGYVKTLSNETSITSGTSKVSCTALSSKESFRKSIVIREYARRTCLRNMNEPCYSVGVWTPDSRNGTVDRIFRGKTAASYSPANHSSCHACLFFAFSPFFRTNAQTVRRTIVAKSIELFDLSFVAYLNEAFRSVRPRFSTAYQSLFNSARLLHRFIDRKKSHRATFFAALIQ